MDYDFYHLLGAKTKKEATINRYEESIKTISILLKVVGIMSLVIGFVVFNMIELFGNIKDIYPIIVAFPVVFVLTTEFVNEGIYKIRSLVPIFVLLISFFIYNHYNGDEKVVHIINIPHSLNQNITPENEEYVTAMRDVESAPLKDRTIGDIVYSVAQVYNLDPVLIVEMVRAESAFTANAISPRGAVGVMQLMPCVYAEEYNINPFDLLQNIIVGVKEIRGYYDRYYEIEDYEERVKFALSAYNAGPGGVQNAAIAAGSMDFREVRQYLPQETKNYVYTIWERYNSKRRASQMATSNAGLERID